MNAKIKGLTAMAAVALAALLAAGCSASNRSSNDSSTDGKTSGEGPAAAPNGGDQDGQLGGGAVGQPNQPAPVEPAVRSIIYTGDLTVRVEDVEATASRIQALVTTAGGFVGSDQRSSSEHSSATATMVLRIPSASFGSTVDAVGKLPGAKELSRAFSQQDVTTQVVDLEARITAAQVGITRILKLMENASSTADLITMENELSRREADLGSLQAQREKLKDLVSLSTLTVYVLGPAAPSPATEDDSGFLAGLRNGWDAFTKSIEVLVTVIGALLPFAIAIGVPLFALLWWSRRRRANRPAVVAAPIHPAYGTAPPPAAPVPAGVRAADPSASSVREAEPPQP